MSAMPRTLPERAAAATSACPPLGFTAQDILDRFGPIPLGRIVNLPFPGTATEADLIRDRHRQERRCELIDGTLVVRGVVTWEEALVATDAGCVLNEYARRTRRGIAINSIACFRTASGNVFSPAAAFVPWEKLPGRVIPNDPIAAVITTAVAEIDGIACTRQEIDRKVDYFFASGVRVVWYVRPAARTVRVFTACDAVTTLGIDDTLDGGAVLPEFAAPAADLFRQVAEG